MGQKANFNVKNKKIELLKKVGIAILVAIILYATIKAIDSVKTDLKNAKQTNNGELASYNTESGYNSLEELLSKYNAEFVRIEETRDFTKIYLKFKYDLFTDEISNESYFNNISKSLAYFLNYRNFEMIDETKNIDIKIYCKKPNITEIVINDDPNYYLNQETNINRGKQNPEETRFTIQAPELQALIDGDWDESKVDWGTRESTCDKYQIYFDEGIKYKVVARKVYNVIFTEKYQGQVELLLNEQKLLKDQINVYRKISEESVKMKEIQKEKIDKLKLEQNMNKDILNRVRKYIQRHFSMDTQQELLKSIGKI